MGVYKEGVGHTVPGLSVIYLNPVSCEALCVYPVNHSLYGKFQQERCSVAGLKQPPPPACFSFPSYPLCQCIGIYLQDPTWLLITFKVCYTDITSFKGNSTRVMVSSTQHVKRVVQCRNKTVWKFYIIIKVTKIMIINIISYC